MTNIDQFESVFKSADKTPFAPERIDIRSVLVVTDMDRASSTRYAEQNKAFLNVLNTESPPRWDIVSGDDYQNVEQMLAGIESRQPDLIAVYRNLRSPRGKHPYSLGEYVDVLTQATPIPVLLTPHPRNLAEGKLRFDNTNSVMAITDHLTGDHHLVSYAAKLTEAQGRLYLTHVEDEATLQRYMDTIARISTIDTDSASEAIKEQLLKEPRDYIRSCREKLVAEGFPIEVEESVVIGHHLSDYKRLINEHEIDLLVLNTKDEDQLAMHGVAYPLTIELRNTPLLLL